MTAQQTALAEILKSNGFEFIDAFEVKEWKEDEDDFAEKIQDRINEQEIIYYSKAIEYLADHDASLMEAMELADDMGYATKDLNSELLATLVYQQNLSAKAGELVKALEEFEFEAGEPDEEQAEYCRECNHDSQAEYDGQWPIHEMPQK